MVSQQRQLAHVHYDRLAVPLDPIDYVLESSWQTGSDSESTQVLDLLLQLGCRIVPRALLVLFQMQSPSRRKVVVR
jgi:hypothetical protein